MYALQQVLFVLIKIIDCVWMVAKVLVWTPVFVVVEKTDKDHVQATF
jgi:hypothetical protein